MKAILFPQYGSPDVLRLVEVDKPSPKEDEVLIKVYASSANPLDWHRMRGTPYLPVHMGEGWRKPRNPRLGADLAGIVEAVGKDVTQFRVGDAVLGVTRGAFAEYTCVQEAALVLKPDDISFDDAAGVPVAAITSLQGLRDKGHIQAGQKVLINGASGGVGTFAVQIAKVFGAEVTGVCSTSKIETTYAIGADYVIDYTKEDFTRGGKRYDLIFDVAANHSVAEMRRVMTPTGICMMAGFGGMIHLLRFVLMGKLASRGEQTIGMMGTAQINQADLMTLKDMLAAGSIKTVIDRCYPLEQTAEAIRYLEEGHARGKVIVTIAS